MPDRLFSVFRNKRLELRLCPLVLQKGITGAPKQRRELGPGVRRAHIDNTDSLDTRARRLGINEMGSVARLHAAPELLFRGDEDTQIERVHGDSDFDPLAPSGYAICRDFRVGSTGGFNSLQQNPSATNGGFPNAYPAPLLLWHAGYPASCRKSFACSEGGEAL
jgi:hypothetical protein